MKQAIEDINQVSHVQNCNTSLCLLDEIIKTTHFPLHLPFSLSIDFFSLEQTHTLPTRKMQIKKCTHTHTHSLSLSLSYTSEKHFRELNCPINPYECKVTSNIAASWDEDGNLLAKIQRLHFELHSRHFSLET